MPRHTPPEDQRPRPHVQIEVPRDDVGLVNELSWAEALDLAAESKWTVRTDSAWGWCAKDHALFREGDDEMKTIPVLLYQNY
jgi:hypothetical protein